MTVTLPADKLAGVAINTPVTSEVPRSIIPTVCPICEICAEEFATRADIRQTPRSANAPQCALRSQKMRPWTKVMQTGSDTCENVGYHQQYSNIVKAVTVIGSG